MRNSNLQNVMHEVLNDALPIRDVLYTIIYQSPTIDFVHLLPHLVNNTFSFLFRPSKTKFCLKLNVKKLSRLQKGIREILNDALPIKDVL